MLQPGLMMDRPLLVSGIIEHAAAQFGDVEVVSRETHGPLFRYTYADCAVRSRRLANALAGLGLGPGAMVGSIAWNNHRHLEAYFAVKVHYGLTSGRAVAAILIPLVIVFILFGCLAIAVAGMIAAISSN